GKYTKDTVFEDGDLRLKKPDFQGEQFLHNLQKVDQLRELAAKKEVDIAQVVLSWYLHCDEIDVIIPGAKNGAQVKGNRQANDLFLTEDEFLFIDDLFR